MGYIVSDSQKKKKKGEFCPFTNSYRLKQSLKNNFFWKNIIIFFSEHRKHHNWASCACFCALPVHFQNYGKSLYILCLVSHRFNFLMAYCWCLRNDWLFLVFQRSIVLFPRSKCPTDVKMICLQATTWFPFTSLQPLKTNQRCSAVRIYRIVPSFLKGCVYFPRSKI